MHYFHVGINRPASLSMTAAAGAPTLLGRGSQGGRLTHPQGELKSSKHVMFIFFNLSYLYVPYNPILAT